VVAVLKLLIDQSADLMRIFKTFNHGLQLKKPFGFHREENRIRSVKEASKFMLMSLQTMVRKLAMTS
jgi:hypothetical protein